MLRRFHGSSRVCRWYCLKGKYNQSLVNCALPSCVCLGNFGDVCSNNHVDWIINVKKVIRNVGEEYSNNHVDWVITIIKVEEMLEIE